ncbi:MAG: non-homologous end-joining DNA ligase [Dermatophilaceae bacterium]|nr:non-homologous end-joining DNA ligase [Dermatophilaceae bacterium]
MRPMLATPTRRVPTGPEWAHEVKWDGMRILADIHDGQVRLTSRTERDVTVAFPELAGLANEFEDMLLDGEAVVLRDGIPSFAALAERFHVTSPTKAAALAARAPVTLMVFDLLRLYGVDLTGRSWTDRRATLERLELQNPHWTVPPTFTDGQALWEATREQGLEGIVSKRRSGRYAAGARTEDWVKLPHRTSQSVVIGGWRPETDQVDRLGAVLVGVPGVGGLRYLGRVGSGIAGKTARALAADLAPLTSAGSPFVDEVPPEDASGTTWVHPVLVCDVQALGLTDSRRLRQPAYRGLRPDLTPGDIDPAELPDA